LPIHAARSAAGNARSHERRTTTARRGRPAHERPAAPTPPDPPPAILTDPWAAAPLVVAVLLAARSWYPFIGEPVSDDFDYLHDARFNQGDWLDGGGSRLYWRPLARQAYFRLLGGTMVQHPAWVAALHVVLAALAGLLLYRALRRSWSGAAAAAAATFPLVMSEARTLLGTPTSFHDLGAILFSAIAVHEASRSRLPTTLAALFAGFLCKETAVVTALLVPWLPGREPADRRRRVRWALASAAVVALWVLLYREAVRHAGLLLMGDPASGAPASAAPWLDRFVWACASGVRDAFSLPALASPFDAAAGAAFGALALVTLVDLVRGPAARSRVRRAAPWIVWGALWFTLTSAALAGVHPDWRPYRSPFTAIGLGIAAVALLGAIHPSLVAILTALRLGTLVLSPAPPSAIVFSPGAFSLEFTELVRLQRLAGETRRELERVRPAPAPGLRIATHHFPLGALHAFAGDKAFQVWYRDTTVHRVPLVVDQPPGRDDRSVALELQVTPPRQVVAVSVEALRHLDIASRHLDRNEWTEALREVALADSLQHDPAARVSRSLAAGSRAVALLGLRRDAEALSEAHRAYGLYRGNVEARYVIALMQKAQGHLRQAEAQFDTLVRVDPENPRLRELLEETRQLIRAQSP
jgi:hypothetical protein